jgi:hypothetical protein
MKTDTGPALRVYAVLSGTDAVAAFVNREDAARAVERGLGARIVELPLFGPWVQRWGAYDYCWLARMSAISQTDCSGLHWHVPFPACV